MPIIHNGSVKRIKTIIENPVATVLSTPKNVNPITVKNWYVPTFEGALGSIVPKC